MAEKSPESQKRYQVAKEFKGVNTKNNRTAIKDEEFGWLENMMPIGFGNLKSTPAAVQIAIAGGANVSWTNTASSLTSVNINNTDYIIAFEKDGRAEYFALQTSTKGNIAGPGTFSSANVTASQWKDERAVIVDPANGLYSWDSNNVVFIGSVGNYAVTNPGLVYTIAPDVAVGPPDDPNGVQATATATIATNAGTLQQVIPQNKGGGYSQVPNVSVQASILPSGTLPVVTGTLLGDAIVAYNVVSPGSGIINPANVVIIVSGGGNVTNVATATAVVNTSGVQSISPKEPGTGYRKPPLVTIVGGGSPTNVATAQAGLINFSTGTISIVPQAGGQGYSNPANLVVTISGGTFTNVATAAGFITGDQFGGAVMTNPGKYTSVPLVSISGGGGSNATAIAVLSNDAPTDVSTFAGRVWVSQGREVIWSAADSYNDFSSVSAGNIIITDTTLHNNIKSLLSANNFLYVIGEDSINVFSDVRVQTDGTTIFTNTNVSASVGSRYPNSVFPYFRTVMFMNDYGIFALVGATTTKLSEPLDGIFPFIDFTKPITAGQVVINNVLCAAFSFTYNDPIQNVARPLQAVFFEKKWFFTSQLGTLAEVTNVPFQGQQQLYATDGIGLYQMYANSSVMVNTLTQGALWGLGDPIRDKRANRLGVEATLTTANAIYVSIDTEASLGQPIAQPSNTFSFNIPWVNNANQTIPWVNNSNQPVNWVPNQSVLGRYNLFKGNAQAFGKYLGFTITSNTGGVTIHTLELEHEYGARF